MEFGAVVSEVRRRSRMICENYKLRHLSLRFGATLLEVRRRSLRIRAASIFFFEKCPKILKIGVDNLECILKPL